MLNELAAGLWVIGQPMRFLGVEVGLRTTIIRLRDGALFVHSPGRLDESTERALRSLGQVGFVIAPNRFHHLFIPEYQRVFADANYFCAPGLDTKRPQLRFDAVLSDQAPSGWAGQLEQMVFTAFPALNEVVFLHPASGTLLLTDLLFNIPWPTLGSLRSRILLRLDGCNGYPAVARAFRLALKFRRQAARELMDRILARDFDRVVLAHGEVIEADGKRILADAWSFL